MTTTYEITSAPKHASIREHDCFFCQAESLRRPVWLKSASGSTVAAGTSCALRVLFGETGPQARRRLEMAQGVAMGAAAVAAEWQSLAAAALADLDRGIDYSPQIQSLRRAFHGRGGAPVLGSFRGYVVHVAQTGNLAR
jgi:hypothetical protein